MRKFLLVGACLCALVLALAATATAKPTPIPGQYVVVLKHGASGRAVAAEHAHSAGARVLHTYDAGVHGYAARLSDSGLARVKADRRVARVIQDVQDYTLDGQTLPTGVNRIDAELSPTDASARAAAAPVAGDVAVFDTGIDVNHPDLNVAGGVNCLGATGPYNDGTYNDAYGHGTHLAGIIGAKDDANGVVGVAPGVRLWAVRVDDAMGVTSLSAQLCGINWINQNAPTLGIRVVNSSQNLMGSADDGNCGNTAGDVLHQAICASTQAGINWVFAAGNSTTDFKGWSGPGYDEVLTVTAMADSNGQPNVGSSTKFTCKSALSSNGGSTSEVDDTAATFSNYTSTTGTEQNHVVAAPGVCIWSTFKGQSYGYLSGTSMAAPHVVGLMQLCIVSGQCTGTTSAIMQKIRSDAAAYNTANNGFGFKGDPLRPTSGKTGARYYGYLVRAAQY